MAKLTIDDILNKISQGEGDDIVEYMGGIANVLKIADMKGALEDVEFWNSPWDDYENVIIYTLLNSENPEVRKKTLENVKTHLINSDLDVINGEWYLVLDDLSDLSRLFIRQDQDEVESVLGEDVWEPFDWNSTDNVYRDVIEELTPQNLEEFKERFSSDCVGMEVDTHTNLLYDICNELESCDGLSLTITENMIDRIIGDEKTMNFILKRYLKDISGDLYNIYSDAYNAAYNDECYDEVWDELDTWFVRGSTTWKEYKRYDGTPSHKVLIKLTDKIDTVIYDWANGYKKDTWRDFNMSYHGRYLDILEKYLDEFETKLSVRFPDYPSVSRNLINDTFNNYF